MRLVISSHKLVPTSLDPVALVICPRFLYILQLDHSRVSYVDTSFSQSADAIPRPLFSIVLLRAQNLWPFQLSDVQYGLNIAYLGR